MVRTQQVSPKQQSFSTEHIQTEGKELIDSGIVLEEL